MPTWRSLPSTIAPTRSASVGGVLEVVRDDDRRAARARRRSSCSSPRTPARVCASRADSGSSRSSTRGFRASARASATRCRSPPEISARPGVARAGRCETARAARRQLARRVRRTRRSPRTLEVREERVVLEDEPDASGAPAAGRRRAPCRARSRRRARRGRVPGGGARRSTRSTLDLPAPDGPTSASVSAPTLERQLERRTRGEGWERSTWSAPSRDELDREQEDGAR